MRGEPEAEWYALMHKRGPALRDGESMFGHPMFGHPMFGEHAAFLRRMIDRGLLVAAGPLTDVTGSGMAVLKVPPSGPDPLDILELASKDDLSVAGGYLTVEVRPWAVVQFTG